jgi:hypothetical protein
METLPSGTYTMETGIELGRWPADGRLTLDLDGLEIGEQWLLEESVTVGNLTVPLREASLITRTADGVEELLLQVTVSGTTGQGSALTCFYLDPDLAALGLTHSNSSCEPQLQGSVGWITSTVTIDSTRGDGILVVPPKAYLYPAGDLRLDGPWSLTWTASSR